MENAIDITGSNLIELVKATYDLSKPQGLGFLHFQEGGLTDEEAAALVNVSDEKFPVHLDYVKGRACKMTVFKKDEKLFIRDKWYDHSEEDLLKLINRISN